MDWYSGGIRFEYRMPRLRRKFEGWCTYKSTMNGWRRQLGFRVGYLHIWLELEAVK